MTARSWLHQGAIGAGIDLATGITIHAITSSGISLKYVPGTKRKINGVLIPFWRKTLLTAVEAANAAGLTYGGIDLFIHKEKGPMVVEMNTQPGLAIQLANRRGLKKRLERLNGLNVLSAEHGVKIAQTLFTSGLTEKIIDPESRTIIKPQQEVVVHGRAKKRVTVTAKVSTAHFRSSISWELVEELDLIHPDDLLWFQEEENGRKNPVVPVTLNISGRKISTSMIVTRQLDKGSVKVRLGRNDLGEFLVEV